MVQEWMGPASELLTAVRMILDESRDLARVSLEDIMLRHGATDEELDRELAFWTDVWADKADREMARLAAWLARGGQALQ